MTSNLESTIHSFLINELLLFFSEIAALDFVFQKYNIEIESIITQPILYTVFSKKKKKKKKTRL